MSEREQRLCKVGYLQLCPERGAVQENLDRIDELLEGARADLLVLPELATTGYTFADRDELQELAEPIPGPTTARLTGVARSVGGHLVIGLAERAGDRLYNSAALIGPSGVLAAYRKAHLFWHERELFDPGDGPFPVARLEPHGLKVGLMICFDWAFPEAAGTLARRGAQLIAHPSNLVLPHARRAMPIRCLENRVFAITANRYGEEQGPDGPLNFRGESMIVGPTGDVLAAAPVLGDELRTFPIDPTDADDKQLTPKNHLFTDRRPELYGEGDDS